jgi:hypothetical protein
VVTSILSAASNLSTRYDWSRAKTLPFLPAGAPAPGKNPAARALKWGHIRVFAAWAIANNASATMFKAIIWALPKIFADCRGQFDVDISQSYNVTIASGYEPG